MRTTNDTGLVVDELRDLADHRAASDLFLDIWGRNGHDSPLVPEVIRAISHAGGYVAGARRGEQLVGASVGFLGLDGDDLILHSHITGIHPDAQGCGIGALLKRHQRAWAARRGLAAITWTFDPLTRRNAWFNLGTLGARAVSYIPDFYGLMDDALNGLDPTDRCAARWNVTGDHVLDIDLAALVVAGAEVVLRDDTDGKPVTALSSASVRLCWVPADIVAMRRADPSRASAWRFALRETMGPAMDDGLVGVAMTRDGWYVLAADDEIASAR